MAENKVVLSYDKDSDSNIPQWLKDQEVDFTSQNDKGLHALEAMPESLKFEVTLDFNEFRQMYFALDGLKQEYIKQASDPEYTGSHLLEEQMFLYGEASRIAAIQFGLIDDCPKVKSEFLKNILGL